MRYVEGRLTFAFWVWGMFVGMGGFFFCWVFVEQCKLQVMNSVQQGLILDGCVVVVVAVVVRVE